MYCTKCGNQVEDSKNCPICKGADTVSGNAEQVQPVSYQTNTTTTTTEKGSDKFSRIFATPNEKPISVIGNGYLESFLATGNLACGYVLLSDRRAYMASEKISSKGLLTRATERHIVDIEDVTRTGYYHTNPLGYLILGILGLLLAIIGVSMTALGLLFIFPGIYYLAKFFIDRDTLYVISFAGGSFALKTKWIKQSEIDKFERDLRLLKDKKEKR